MIKIPTSLIFIIRRIQYLSEIFKLPILVLLCLVARFCKKQKDIGLGPEPLINNRYHKSAMKKYGYDSETFVTELYFITEDFDVKFYVNQPRVVQLIAKSFCLPFVFSIFRYRAVYFYFNGCTLFNSQFLWRFEPFLYSLAAVRTVVMPYGGDVHDLSRCPNLLFKHAMALDYPNFRLSRQTIAARIDLWSRHADHVIGGCDWVDYLYFWHTLMLAHFSIDTEQWRPTEAKNLTGQQNRPLRILHAPNHREIKGSKHFLRAVEELQSEGVSVELVVLERVPNEQVREVMQTVDVVADQLVIGWYAMFALEAMALGKPVLCYLRDDLYRFYVDAGLVTDGEIPIIRCTVATVKEVIRDLAMNRQTLLEIGAKGREFVERRHSLAVVGAVFDKINRHLGIQPQRET